MEGFRLKSWMNMKILCLPCPHSTKSTRKGRIIKDPIAKNQRITSAIRSKICQECQGTLTTTRFQPTIKEFTKLRSGARLWKLVAILAHSTQTRRIGLTFKCKQRKSGQTVKCRWKTGNKGLRHLVCINREKWIRSWWTFSQASKVSMSLRCRRLILSLATSFNPGSLFIAQRSLQSTKLQNRSPPSTPIPSWRQMTKVMPAKFSSLMETNKMKEEHCS